MASSVLELLPQDPLSLAGIAVAVVAVLAGAAYFLLSSKKQSKGSLDPETWRSFRLVKRIQVSHNVVKFRFALPTPTSVLGLPIGQHVSCLGQDKEGEEVIKPYTPTTLDSDIGYFELVIKIYSHGRMSHHFSKLQVGDSLSVRGPKGRFRYTPGSVKAFGMLAGGTGLTPMFQVARAILENPKDATKIYLIYANVAYEDILLKEELDKFQETYPGRFSVHYVLEKPPEGWKGSVGYVSKDLVESFLPAPSSDIQILRCGPPMMNKAMQAHLEALEYPKEILFQF
ncbi:hypothetical protein GOP47_0005014 [Adiantum capillus-veneris]|uniref:NADH-cytochrome b5 reductase n=1 Tax=Adiantum capillus-veneris TaxID=13818 RepID=A0A9D4V4Y3_ADICA|nr:hypothetical protein GOP47_0005014 [Adiantum capillus-veneris]